MCSPAPGLATFTTTRPITSAAVETTSKYRIARTPIRPTSFIRPIRAIPPVTVVKMIGAISILISLMKPSPSGFMAAPYSGTAKPSATPSVIPMTTWTYKLRRTLGYPIDAKAQCSGRTPVQVSRVVAAPDQRVQLTRPATHGRSPVFRGLMRRPLESPPPDVRRRARRASLWCCIVAALLAAGCGEAPARAAATRPTVRMATGLPGASFRPLTTGILKGLRAQLPAIDFVAIDTPGSNTNLEHIQSGAADIGLAYSDGAYRVYIDELRGGRHRDP